MPKKIFFKNHELDVFDSVYEPLEDSLLLANAVQIKPVDNALDLGCGCGIQGINLVLQGASQVICLDINPLCLQNTRHNFKKNGFENNLQLIESDLFEKIPFNQKFDVIVFNPPYVASENLRWKETDGGKKGREILDRFLDSVEDFLKPIGTVFFLQTDLNGISQTEQKLKKRNFRFEIVARQKLFFEELVIFKACRCPM